MQNASPLWLGQKKKKKITCRDQRMWTETADFQSRTALRRMSKPANYSSSLYEVDNYPPATVLKQTYFKEGKGQAVLQ